MIDYIFIVSLSHLTDESTYLREEFQLCFYMYDQQIWSIYIAEKSPKLSDENAILTKFSFQIRPGDIFIEELKLDNL